MTPKEEAIELINRYNIVVLDTALGGSNRRVKQCSHIAVNKLLEYSKAHGFIGLTEHYEQVKIEIDKL